MLDVVPHDFDIRLRFSQFASDDFPTMASSLIHFQIAEELLVLVRPNRRAWRRGLRRG